MRKAIVVKCNAFERSGRKMLTIIPSLLITACSSLAPDAPVVVPPPSTGIAPALRLTVPPAVLSPILVKTAPDAVCTLYSGDVSDSEQSLKLNADTNGVIRFFVRPAKESEVSTHIVVRCGTGVKMTIYPIYLRASATPTPDMPALAPAVPVTPRGTHLAALTKEEALRLSDTELLERGYPSRPDPQVTPDAFAVWQRALSKPTIRITPHAVPRQDIQHGQRISLNHGSEFAGNWSGYELRSYPGSFAWVQGEWNVPSVTGEATAPVFSSTWVGLDGDGTVDLVQAGTSQDVMGVGDMSVSYYEAWTEFIPQQSLSMPAFVILPGDDIYVQVFIADHNGRPNLSGKFGNFVFMNLTRDEVMTVETPVGATVVGGSGAEWIVERPLVDFGKGLRLPDLANYSSMSIQRCFARGPVKLTRPQLFIDDQKSIRLEPPPQGLVAPLAIVAPLFRSNAIQITMVNSGVALSTAVTPDGTTVDFTWHAFH